MSDQGVGGYEPFVISEGWRNVMDVPMYSDSQLRKACAQAAAAERERIVTLAQYYYGDGLAGKIREMLARVPDIIEE